MKICLFWSTVYSGNMGVNALTYSAIHYLEEVGRSLQIEFEYVLIGTGRNEFKQDELNLGDKTIRFSFYPVYGHNYKQALLTPKILPFYDEVKSSEFVLDLGEGDSFSDIYGAARLKMLLRTKLYCKRLRKKVVIFPQTIGPFKKAKSKWASNLVLSSVHKLYVRDDLSYDYCKKHVFGKNKIKKFTDLAFGLPYLKTVFAGDKIKVGINVSGLLWNGGYDRNNQFNLQLDYPSLIRDLIAYFDAQPNVQLHLVSHVLTELHPIEDDYTICELLHAEFPSTIVAPKFSSPVEAKNYISGFNFFVGARMHACIAALSASVPVVPIAYSRKFTGLFSHTLGYSYVADATIYDGKKLFDFIKESFGNVNKMQEDVAKSELRIAKFNLSFKNELLDVFAQKKHSRLLPFLR